MTKEQGYRATVTYEGVATYPDTPPSLRASPYAPPTRRRTARARDAGAKFKRQSKKAGAAAAARPRSRLNDDLFAEVYGESRLRPERRLPDPRPRHTEDLQQSSSENIVSSLSSPLYREKVLSRKRKKVSVAKKVTTSTTPKQISTPAPEAGPAATAPLDLGTELEDIIEQLEEVIAPTEAVILPEFVRAVETTSSIPSTTTTSTTTTSTPAPSSRDSLSAAENAAEVHNSQDTQEGVDNNSISQSDVSLSDSIVPNVLLSSLHSSTTSPSSPDYDFENLKEIEIIGNTVSDDDEEYFEDYYNFPLGARITSVVSNESEDVFTTVYKDRSDQESWQPNFAL